MKEPALAMGRLAPLDHLERAALAHLEEDGVDLVFALLHAGGFPPFLDRIYLVAGPTGGTVYRNWERGKDQGRVERPLTANEVERLSFALEAGDLWELQDHVHPPAVDVPIHFMLMADGKRTRRVTCYAPLVEGLESLRDWLEQLLLGIEGTPG